MERTYIINTDEIVKQCCLLPGVTVTEEADDTELHLSTAEGTGRMRFIPLFPGVVLALISISAHSGLLRSFLTARRRQSGR